MAQVSNFNDVLLISGFSNYLDRKIFYYSNFSDYEALDGANKLVNINFNPNDGVDTELVLTNLNTTDYSEDFNIDEVSYCIIGDGTADTVASRWFVMRVVRSSKGIYTIILKRDVVGESIGNLTFVGEAPVYVEKAILQDGDPMIVNDEGMSFNQIKTRDMLLSRAIEEVSENNFCGFVVGYFANNTPTSSGSVAGESIPTIYYTLSQISTATGIPQTTLEAMINGALPIVSSDFKLTFGSWDGLLTHWKYDLDIPQTFTADTNGEGVNMYSGVPVFAWEHAVVSMHTGLDPFTIPLKFMEYVISNLASTWTGQRAAIQDVVDNDNPTEVIITTSQLSKLQAYEGAMIYYQGEYRKMSLQVNGEQDHAEIVISKGESTYFNALMTNAIADLNAYDPSLVQTQLDGWELYLNYKVRLVQMVLDEDSDRIGLSWSIPDSHAVLMDAPYSIFVIPYGTIDQVIYDYGSTPPVFGSGLYPTKNEILSIASDIATQLGQSLYDIQLLPFMPQEMEFMRYSAGDNIIAMKNKTLNTDYTKITNADGDNCGAIFFPKVSNESFSIRKPLIIEHSMKIDSQCCFYRLCSPNYSGVFEFNLAKDGGEIYNFLVDCTFKPFNPFIRVTPEFNFLYGANYKDGRGLICGGDFSLPITRNEWINYELNNKNYASIFGRDIQNLSFTQSQERFREKFTYGAGIVGGTAGGAAAGAKVGGVYGAIAGAAIGLTAGSVGAALDSRLNESRRKEDLDYSIDKFNLSLGNIKAIPNSLAKSSAYNITSKIFPFLEFYTCTDEEIAALENKITYSGMTVNRIDNIINYMGGNQGQKYFKGQLIRAVGIDADNHYLAALFNELEKGVYI